jgi:glycosyltransferase involved in cell wall biosynthesis
LIARIKPDVVHFFHFYRLGVGLIDVTNERGIPAFFTPTDYWSVCPTMTLTLADGTRCSGPLPNAGNCLKHLASVHQVSVRAALINVLPETFFELSARWLVRSSIPRVLIPQNVLALVRRKRFVLDRLGTLTGIFAPTRAMVQLVEAQGIDPGRIIESGFGVDLRSQEDDPSPRSRHGRIVVGFIGTLKALKGCLVLLQAVEALPPGALEVVVYGRASDDPEYFEQVRSKADSLPFVTLAGTFPGEHIGRILGGIDVLVVPSLWDENTPLVVLNALAAHCPVIGSDVDGINAVIKHGHNGLLFPRGDWRALQKLLEQFLREPSLLDSLRENCGPIRSVEDYVTTLLLHYESATTAARVISVSSQT